MAGKIEGQRAARRRAAALDEAHDEFAGARLERKAQAGGRRLARRRRGTKEKGEPAPGLRGDREALQLGIAQARQPGEQRLAGGGPQHLLGGPERFAPLARLYDDELRDIDPGGGKRRRVRYMRRRETEDPLPGGAEARYGRQDELQLAYAGGVAEQLGQLAARPAATGQPGIQGAEAGGYAGRALREARPAPYRLALQDVIQPHTVIIYSIADQRPPFRRRSCAW